MALSLPRLCAILDAALTGERRSSAAAETLLAAGVRWIQYRDKRATSRELFERGCEIAAVVRGRAIFIVNDRADVARAVEADGVHLGQEDLPVTLARRMLGPGKLIGYSTHLAAQVVEADRSEADYIGFGPIFPTRSKENPDPAVGLEGLRQARRLTAKPLVAIGGITLENARAALDAGADSVAVIRDLFAAPDLEARAREFLRTLADHDDVR